MNTLENSDGDTLLTPTGKVIAAKGRRPKKPLLSSNEDIAKVTLEGGRQWALGGNLHLLITPKGSKSFRYRTFVDGKERSITIGHYPEMDLAAARDAVAKLTAKKAPKDVLGRPPIRTGLRPIQAPRESTYGIMDRIPTLRFSSDFHRFLRNLMFELPESELSLAVWLLIYIPISPALLYSARWDPVNPGAQEFKLHVQRKNGEAVSRRILLNTDEFGTLNRLWTLSKSSEFLFPSLQKLPLGKAHQLIAETVLKPIWREYPIHPSGFRTLFRDTAIRSSGFTQQFIDSYMAPTAQRARVYDTDYDPQRQAIAVWWERQINAIRHDQISVAKKNNVDISRYVKPGD